MPIRIREATDLAGCVAALRRVHEASGYPSRWPENPGGWLTPGGFAAAWVAEHDGVIAGHAALISGVRLECLLRTTGLPPSELGGITRLYVDPSARRPARLLDCHHSAYHLQPVLRLATAARPSPCMSRPAGRHPNRDLGERGRYNARRALLSPAPAVGSRPHPGRWKGAWLASRALG